MRTLQRKLLRDLAGLKGQVAAIATVIGAGVMVLIIAVTSMDAITLSQERFYREQRFADLFVGLTRAPDHVGDRLEALPGVDRVQTRVVAPVRMEVAGFDDPVRGQLLSLPAIGGQPRLNQLHLRRGRLPEPGRNQEVVVGEPFAEAHGLALGDELTATIHGRQEPLRVVGVALSPEFVYQVGPADLLPDYARYGVFWMNRQALGSARDMEGAFNNAVVSLQSGASPDRVIAGVDRILAPYGGRGAHGRMEQTSHRFLHEEVSQLGNTAVALPTIFLGVAAFLLSVFLGRVVRNQRQEVAALKAFGYDNGRIAGYYAQFTGLVVLLGCALGVLLGAWAARGVAALYMEYFRFPVMDFRLRPGVILLAVGVAAAAAAVGVAHAVRGVVRMPPAEAMRPPVPGTFRHGWLERLGLLPRLGQGSRIIVRNLARHRLKASLSTLGIGLSGALLLVGGYQFGAVDRLIDTQYRVLQKMDVDVLFTEPTSDRVLAELRHYPGVRYVEGYRQVAVRLNHGPRSERIGLLGMEAASGLRGLRDEQLGELRLPPAGLLMTDYLAEQLGAEPGDRLEVEVLEGERSRRLVTLVETVEEPVGVGAYMERRALNRLLGEGPALNGAWLLVDTARKEDLFRELQEAPRVGGVGLVQESERAIRAYIGDTVLTMMAILLLLAGSIAFAVAYNNARIALAERARELATLRVLGLRRGEVAWILVGEIGLISLLAIPLGWGLGTLMAWLLSQVMSMDLLRIPFHITPSAYALSALGVIVASLLSIGLVARRLYRLDMLNALKSVE